MRSNTYTATPIAAATTSTATGLMWTALRSSLS